MAWNVEFTLTAKKQLKKVDKKWQEKVLDYLEEVSVLEDPRSRGKALIGNKKGLWRYRVGDYRVICQIIDNEFIILTVTIGHRKDMYSK